MSKQIQLVTNAINGEMVRKEEFQGEMHYMISSATMPDDIVMNRVLYPAEEIKASYKGLEGVPAPAGHPVSDDGEFISASTTFAFRNYGIYAQVVNVERKNGKIYHDTAINIAAAKQSDRGKRVLDRIEALKRGDNTPIHTSTGIWLNREDLVEPQTNQYGEYNSIARGLVFDHNAILLDEVGAATPEQGTGMAVHSSKDQKVFNYMLNVEGEVVAESGDDMYDEMHALSRAIREEVSKAHASEDNQWVWISELHDSYVIAEIEKGGDRNTYKIPYMVEQDKITIGDLQEVKRNIVYTAVNSLKTFIKSMGFASGNHEPYNVEVNKQTEGYEMTPEDLKAALAEQATALQANFETSLASAVKPLQDKVDALEANAQSAEKAEKAELAEKLGIEAEEAEGMSVNTLKKLAANHADAGEFGGDRLGALEVNSGQGGYNLDVEAP